MHTTLHHRNKENDIKWRNHSNEECKHPETTSENDQHRDVISWCRMFTSNEKFLTCNQLQTKLHIYRFRSVEESRQQWRHCHIDIMKQYKISSSPVTGPNVKGGNKPKFVVLELRKASKTYPTRKRRKEKASKATELNPRINKNRTHRLGKQLNPSLNKIK